MGNVKLGFTLAEILFTLVVIGVIASTVIPSVLSDISKKELLESAKKQYSTIYQALLLAKAENGEV